MRAIIKCLDPDGAAIGFETEEMKLAQLLPLIPQIKMELIKAGYELVDTHPAQPVTEAAPQSLSFPVSELTATVSDGKEYWRVKGGQFQKWGVIVYPEVLEAAGLSDLNPLETYSETGLVATYCLKENGKPKKVIRLDRVG